MKASLRVLLVLMLVALLPTLTLGQADEAGEVAEAAAEVALDVVEVLPAVEAPEPAVDDPAKPEEETTSTDTPPAKPEAEKTPPGTLRFHLMDGSIITGKLATDTLPIKTEFGNLVVPVTKIVSMAPGLESHPKLDDRIQELIQKLGSPDSKTRDQSQAELISFGKGLIPELQRFADDPDAERKVRIGAIIEEFYAQDDPFMGDGGPSVSLVRLDTIVTAQFTVAGNIQQDTFNIHSKFGKLVVKLEDIKAAERLTSEQPEVRRSVDVMGSNMADRNYKNTGIRLNRGDRIMISADGQITMSPWGSNQISTPDGAPNCGNYQGNIPMGALVGRVGEKGAPFLVGSKKSFVAQKSGTLYLGFAMQQNWANYQFPGKYEARIRVSPSDE